MDKNIRRISGNIVGDISLLAREVCRIRDLMGIYQDIYRDMFIEVATSIIQRVQ